MSYYNIQQGYGYGAAPTAAAYIPSPQARSDRGGFSENPSVRPSEHRGAFPLHAGTLGHRPPLISTTPRPSSSRLRLPRLGASARWPAVPRWSRSRGCSKLPPLTRGFSRGSPSG